MRQRPRSGVGPVGGQPAERPLEGGGRVIEIVEALTPLGQLVALDEFGGVGAGPVDGGQRLSALPQQCGAANVIEPALDLADDGLPGDGIADQERIAQSGRGIGGHQDVRHRCPGRRGGGLDGRLEFHAGELPLSGRRRAQDQ